MPLPAPAPAASVTAPAAAPAPALGGYGALRRPADAPAARMAGPAAGGSAPNSAAFGRPAAARPPVARPAPANPYAAQASRYRDAELTSATPGQLVVMLFDKLQLTLRRARVALDAGRIEERTELVIKAYDMLTELRCCLDHEQGGAITAQLDALYGWALGELLEANRRNDGQRLDHVLRMAGELRDAFAGALSQLGSTATPTAAAAPAALPPRQARSA